MKQLILRLLGVPDLLQQAKNQGFNEQKKIQSEKDKNRTSVNYPVGSKVMVIGNSPPEPGDGDLLVATVVNYDDLGHSLLPVLEKANGEKFCTMAKLIHFDENRYQVLKRLSWWERWNVVTEWGPSLNSQEATNLEANRPAWDNG